MTDNEIIKALECCGNDSEVCAGCPLHKAPCTCDCTHILAQYAFDLINRQKAEIEKYRHIEQTVKDFWSELKKLSAFKNLQEPTLTELLEYIEYANAEAVKEFAHLLIDKSENGIIYAADVSDLAVEKAGTK